MTYELVYYIYIIFTEHNSCTMWKMSTPKSLLQVALSWCSCTQCFPRALQCCCCKLPQEGQMLQNTVVFHIEVIKRKYNHCGLKALNRKGALSATICWRIGERSPHLQRPAQTPATQMLPRAKNFSPSGCSITRVMWQHRDLHLHASLSRTPPVHLGALSYPAAKSGSGCQWKEQEKSLILEKRV